MLIGAELGLSLGLFFGLYKTGKLALSRHHSSEKSLPLTSVLSATALFFLCQFALRFFAPSVNIIKPLLLPGVAAALYLLARKYPIVGPINFANLTEGIKWTCATRWIVMVLGVALSSIVTRFLGAHPAPQTIVRAIRTASEGAHVFQYGSIILSVGFLVPILEELFFRGFLQSYFRGAFGPNVSILSTSLIFALCHFQSRGLASNFVTLPIVFVSSLFIGRIYERTRSLAAPVGMHIANNLIASALVIFCR